MGGPAHAGVRQVAVAWAQTTLDFGQQGRDLSILLVNALQRQSLHRLMHKRLGCGAGLCWKNSKRASVIMVWWSS